MPEHELVLHVGTHKTGTTAIQAYMSQCRAHLAAQGILYPSLRPGLWKEMAGHHKMAQAIARFSAIDRVRLRRYRAWIDQARTRFRVTVLSAEPIYRHVVGKVAPGDTQGWFLAHRAYLRRLAQWLDGFRVQPVVYFRQPDEFAASVYKEHIVRRLLTGSERDFKAFVTATAQYYDYSDHIDALRDAFGCVVVRDYDAARRRGLQVDFAAQLGARDLPPPVQAAVRNSPGNKATLWLAAQPEGRSRRDYFRRVLFAVRAARDEPFSEPEPTTLWADATTFSNFVARHRTSWDLPFLSMPVWRDLPPTLWATDDQAKAEVAFRDWEARNLNLLRQREARDLAFYEPDPT